MYVIGNILLALAGITFLILTTQYYLKPMPGGDYGVGYAWGIIYLNLFFMVCLAGTTAIIGANGGFQWVASSGWSRFGWVSGGLLLIVVLLAVAGMGMNEGPKWMQLFFRILAFFMPVILLVIGFGLNNPDLRQILPPALVQWPLKIMSGMGALVVAGFVVQSFAPGIMATYRAITADPNELDSFQLGSLANIDSCDVQKNMIFLLVHTDKMRNPIIRERALQKMKTRPDWQEELVRRLDSGWAEEVFTFLGSNEVPDKSLFPEAVRKGILQQAKIFHDGIKDGRTFYREQFGTEVHNVLNTVQQFQEMGVDYAPAIRELRAALKTRTNVEKPTFLCEKVLDKWLSQHGH